MRYRFLVISLVFILSACSFQVDIWTPAPSVSHSPTPIPFEELLSATPPPFPTFTFTPYSPDMGTRTATPPPYPTFTFTPTITPSPLPVNLGVTPIRFGANGTYMDVVDTILAGTSKTYSVSAMKGQVMSISVHQSEEGNWTVIPMKIVGADGTILCPPQANRECYFWRGVLPSTQEYFITLTPATDVLNFTLRVVIPPLSANKQTFLYQNETAILTYTDEFAPARFHGAEVYKIAPALTLELIDMNSYLNTNLLEAYFLFGSSSDGTLLQTCMQPVSLGGPENIIGEETVDNLQFTHSKGGGIAAGNIYELTYYRTVYEDVCYEVTYFVHYGNIGAYSPGSGVQEFDRAALMQRFKAVLSTLVIK